MVGKGRDPFAKQKNIVSEVSKKPPLQRYDLNYYKVVSIYWGDLDIGIDWPIKNPILAEKDATTPRLRELATVCLPWFIG